MTVMSEVQGRKPEWVCRSAAYCKKYGRNKHCSRCMMRRYAINNPLRYTYSRLKGNAKRRGKEFKLTLEEWKEFCDRTNYLALRGLGANDMTVDRIRDELGYQADNIQMLTRRENRLKKKTYAKYEPKEDDPF